MPLVITRGISFPIPIAIGTGQADSLIPMKINESVEKQQGGLAHLARASDWQSGGNRFKSDILHFEKPDLNDWVFFVLVTNRFFR